MIFYFGSWERREGEFRYMISSMCDCPDVLHRQEYMMSKMELDSIRFDPFPMVKAKMDNKYEKIHQISIHL